MKKVILVFGSNTEGRHGAGVAKTARDKWGAEYGNPKGMQGDSYAIITKDLSKGLRSIDLEDIKTQIDEFWRYTIANPSTIFIVSPIGCGLAGYKMSEIKPLFKNHTWLNNVYFHFEFL
jgi:hypothetical protein